jgi:hypothetical protein
MQLKDGSETLDPRMDRIYELDYNSLNYSVKEKPTLSRDFDTYTPRSYTWELDETLDQGTDGACGGFAGAHEMLARPQPIKTYEDVPVDNKFAKEEIYWPAQELDEWAGGAYPNAKPFYEGTSILAVAKRLRDLAVCDSFYWALNLHQFVIGVGYDGPCIIGVNMYQGMCSPGPDGFIEPLGTIVGGHAMLVYGIKIVWKSWVSKLVSRKWENVDLDRSYVKIKNSWGLSFGINGTCYMSLRNFQRLLFEQGDACFLNRTYRYF